MKTRNLRYLVLTVISGIVVYYALGFGNRSFENFCPFGGIESLWGLFKSGQFSCALAPSNLSMLVAVLVLVILAKKAFCSWICPIGFISELVFRLRSLVWKKYSFTIPEKVDRPLRLLRYVVLAVILFFTYRTGELIFRGYDPFYAIFSGFGHETLGWITYSIIAIFFVGSFFVPMFFCRYFCPLSAVFDPFSSLGLIKVTRDAATCIDCGKCHKACPHALHPEKVTALRDHDCTNCLECIDACPVKDCMNLKAKV